jgi:hypothetical protein
MFSATGKLLPAPHGQRMVEHSFGSAASMRAARVELELRVPLCAAVAAGGDGDRPHLIVSADRVSDMGGSWLGKLLSRGAAQRTRGVMQRVQEQHRRRAAACRNAAWETLPHHHGGLVFSEDGAQDCAARILRFARELA